jgi:outer membrane immunogenic protein
MFSRLQLPKILIGCLSMLFVLAANEASAGAPPIPFVTTVAGANSANAASGLFGGHAGYNWQQGAVVFGFETDLQRVNLVSSMEGGLTTTPPPPGPTDFARTQATTDWYGTLRGRIGVTSGPFMAYLTGGVAYGNVDLSSTFSAFGLITQFQNSQTRVGGVAGFGFEYILQPNLIATFNYQYVDLGRINGLSSTAAIGNFSSVVLNQSAGVHAQFQVATIGLTWRFAPASTGSPWAGAYGGVHGGGAWGNSANGLYNGVATLIPN